MSATWGLLYISDVHLLLRGRIALHPNMFIYRKPLFLDFHPLYITIREVSDFKFPESIFTYEDKQGALKDYNVQSLDVSITESVWVLHEAEGRTKTD